MSADVKLRHRGGVDEMGAARGSAMDSCLKRDVALTIPWPIEV